MLFSPYCLRYAAQCFIPGRNIEVSLALRSLALRSLEAWHERGRTSAQMPRLCSQRVINEYIYYRFLCHKILALSKLKYKYQGPFSIPSRLGERLMIPAEYVEELKNAPVQEVDFVGILFEVSV